MQWFDILHNHPQCTNFIHDILDIVETKMIVVLSKSRTRASSDKLRAEFENLHSLCMDDSNTDYCLKGAPRPLPPSRAATAVEANLTEIAKLTIAELQPDLPSHDPSLDGKIRKAMRSEQLENIDYYRPIYDEPEQNETD